MTVTPKTTTSYRPDHESCVYRSALALVLIFSGVALVALFGPGWGEATRAALPLAGDGYLKELFSRTVNSPYQTVLFAGWVAIIAHGLWYLTHTKSLEAAQAYNAFSNWAQPAFTAVGFLGTIIGVSLAIGGLQDAMDKDDPTALISGLSVAFDTTFLGLTATITLMILQRFVMAAGARKAETTGLRS